MGLDVSTSTERCYACHALGYHGTSTSLKNDRRIVGFAFCSATISHQICVSCVRALYGRLASEFIKCIDKEIHNPDGFPFAGQLPACLVCLEKKLETIIAVQVAEEDVPVEEYIEQSFNESTFPGCFSVWKRFLEEAIAPEKMDFAFSIDAEYPDEPAEKPWAGCDWD